MNGTLRVMIAFALVSLVCAATTTEQDVEDVTLATTTLPRTTRGPVVPPTQLFDDDKAWPLWSTPLQRIRWKLEDALHAARSRLRRCKKDKKCIAGVRRDIRVARAEAELARARHQRRSKKTICMLRNRLFEAKGSRRKLRCTPKPVACHIGCRAQSFRECGVGLASALESCRKRRYSACLQIRKCKTQPRKPSLLKKVLKKVRAATKRIIKAFSKKCQGSRICLKLLAKVRRSSKRKLKRQLAKCRSKSSQSSKQRCVTRVIRKASRKLKKKLRAVVKIVRKCKAATPCVKKLVKIARTIRRRLKQKIAACRRAEKKSKSVANKSSSKKSNKSKKSPALRKCIKQAKLQARRIFKKASRRQVKRLRKNKKQQSSDEDHGYGDLDTDAVVQEAHAEMLACADDEMCLSGVREATRQILSSRIRSVQRELDICDDLDCRKRLKARIQELQTKIHRALRRDI